MPSEHFGEYPGWPRGIALRTWRTGEPKGQPKIPPAVQSMLDGGLVAIRRESRWPVVVFTADGLAALRQLLLDRRAMDPGAFCASAARAGWRPERVGQGCSPCRAPALQRVPIGGYRKDPVWGQPANPRGSACRSRFRTGEACQRVPPRGVRSRMASS